MVAILVNSTLVGRYAKWFLMILNNITNKNIFDFFKIFLIKMHLGLFFFFEIDRYKRKLVAMPLYLCYIDSFQTHDLSCNIKFFITIKILI